MEKMLKGVNVIDFTLAAAGPGCTKVLQDFGAETILIEPLEGTTSRTNAPHTFNYKCGGKKSVPVNLKTPEGKEFIYKLVEWADVFVSNYRAGALDRLGLSYEKLSEINPRLVYATLSAYGARGPKKNDPGYDTTAFWAVSGMMSDISQKDESIINAPIAIGDVAAGQGLVTGICAALYNREKTGKGINITTSLLGEAVFLNFDAIIESQYGSKYPKSRTNPFRPALNTYRCGDGKWITINFQHHWDETWPAICRFIGREELIDKYPNKESTMGDQSPIVVKALDEGFSRFTREEVVSELKKCGGIAVEPVITSIDVVDYPQCVENEFLVASDDKNADGKSIMIPVQPLRFGDDHPSEYVKGPQLGENTVEIMKMVGYDDDSINDCIRRGIFVSSKQ